MIARQAWLQVAAAILILAWRAAASPSLWRDAVAIAAVYWIFLALAPASRLRPGLTAAAAAFLLGLYVQGQAVHVLTVLGLRP